MEPERFGAWLEQIMKTEQIELSCSECFDSVSGYVEALLAGAPQTEHGRRVKLHLGQCRVCREEFETLYALVRQDRDAEERPSAG